ncbi:arsenate reductase ArsC [Flaviaesturariibacter amylovorans]|uniref:Arsenate reductase ArsC n=1 Tax=Flaviaesturariibacter amylovorans TaxID=1084520 RepID=A0ABP8HF50_9BACT
MKRILVLCTGNSCRSQIAEGYLKHFGGTALEVRSAGIEAHGVNPRAVATMKADGIDISGQSSNRVDEYAGESFDYVLTVCDNAQERCPHFPASATKLHAAFPDPAKATGSEAEIEAAFRQVREEIKEFCRRLAGELVQATR